MIQFPVNHFAESRSKFVVNVEMDPHLQGGPGEKKAKGPAPTVEQIQSDIITQLANQYWSPQRGATRLPFNPKIIDDIYQKEILGTKFAMRRTMMLEFSQYLENYLWPNFTEDKASRAHILTICVMVNEKFRERVPAWEAFQMFPDKFGGFFSRVMATSLADDLTLREQTVLLVFLNHCFNSVEVDLIREQFQSIVSLTMWASILPGRRDEIFKKFPKMKKFWKVIQKKDAKLDAAALEKATNERCFLSRLIHKFYTILESIPETGDLSRDKVMYCERFLELLIGLESLLPTRRFFNVLLDDHHFIVRCTLAKLGKREEGKLFSQLLDMLKFYTDFQINDYTGEALTDLEMTNNHYNKFLDLQRAAFKYYPEDLRKFAVSNVGSVDTRETLLKHFGELSNLDLQMIASYLNLVEPPEENKGNAYNSEFLLEILVSRNMRRQSQLEALNDMPLYPTEEVIWDENVVPTAYFSGEGCLALPKLNLQFLTLHDYLLRNFHLFRLESTYEIRQDVEESVSKMQPWKAEDGTTLFNGWARMAQPIVSFSVVEVAKPNLGENHPARVRADITLHLSVRPEIKNEWENLRKHDVAFLVTVRPQHGYGKRYNHKEPFIPQVGLTYVRGCEIEGLLDADGKVIEEGPEPKPDLPGDTRTYRVWLDPNQYQTDMAETVEGKEDVYETFNIMMRRRPKENNFKAVLETIRDLMNTQCVVPDWLHDIILGYGDPGAAHYSKMPNFISSLDWNDTFLNYDHLVSCFPGWTLKPKVTDPAKLVPPFRLTFPSNSGKKKADEEEEVPENTILVEPHVIPNRGPYPYSQPKRNAIQFTPTQVEAIKAGMQPGLTMVVGPPGTGKTDVAVQIISNLYHNFPNQRTLIVTHSNQALNQLFEKIMALDVDERHLLRMGHGEEALETEKDFSRYGRVNYVLAQRLELLEEVGRLQESLGVPGDVAYTCETASYFYLYQVLARWEEFLSKVKVKPGQAEAVEKIAELFPFTKFFENAPQPVFKGQSYAEDLDIAEGCFRHVKRIFTQLEEFRAFELLRSGSDRSKYLLVKEAKIIAMTCTHAALKRRDLVDLGFEYDNILMEESAQILEIETFIPLLLQNPRDNLNRLKRWIMIGDHHQLPPVIKNMAFQKYSNMEQSLFTRFVRLGVPTVDLDAQGRARPSLCNLYNWRYKKLGNLSHVSLWPEFRTANPGFFFDFQLIDVGDFNGVGESEPTPYFYQNLAEAEYVVAVFMYMRLLGYPAQKISILTTYNGQKNLIRDVIAQRCGNNPLIGRPFKVTTVDRYQGQQNDYILLSLVRTNAVGYFRDVRRLVVAMSRARLGLYIFARTSLFQNCFELTPAFNQLTARPVKLHLAPHEVYPPARPVNAPPQEPPVVLDDMPHMANFVYEFYRTKVEVIMQQRGMYQRPAELRRPPPKQQQNLAPPESPSQKPVEPVKEDKTVMEEHPGAGSDSDSEDEGNQEETPVGVKREMEEPVTPVEAKRAKQE
ncbi:intron-binding protein aquarius-like isoform X1 [Lingula anatina]|uniref:RNA helicase aquarius n=2 Tax=Lingula anatina TaxID=7574 RepID=A0A1S3H887_LINAN|nr:intron-binding protein aquarius-like isoform X1 [Lingula anatina]|eukprot:XP_013382213.1 intron-binding protein aquarius-like isoform X1 [Lingula anatina]